MSLIVFFSKLMTLFEVLATFNCPLWKVGDFIRLERSSEKDSQMLAQMLEALNLTQLVRESTHKHEGSSTWSSDRVTTNLMMSM